MSTILERSTIVASPRGVGTVAFLEEWTRFLACHIHSQTPAYVYLNGLFSTNSISPSLKAILNIDANEPIHGNDWRSSDGK